VDLQLVSPGTAVPAVPQVQSPVGGTEFGAEVSGGLSDQFLMEFIGELPWSGVMRQVGGELNGAAESGVNDEVLDLQSFMGGAEPAPPGPVRAVVPGQRKSPSGGSPSKVRPPLRLPPRVMTVSGQSE
jgi:hypothetical protein